MHKVVVEQIENCQYGHPLVMRHPLANQFRGLDRLLIIRCLIEAKGANPAELCHVPEIAQRLDGVDP